MTSENWQLRSVTDELVERYVAESWWTDQSLGEMVADGLANMRDVAFNVHSKMRSWRGTFGEVDQRARALAATLSVVPRRHVLRRRGRRPPARRRDRPLDLRAPRR